MGKNGKCVLSVEINSNVRESLDLFCDENGVKIRHVVGRAILDYIKRGGGNGDHQGSRAVIFPGNNQGH
jgi:hypothetical protein